jgi:hypothetical protein
MGTRSEDTRPGGNGEIHHAFHLFTEFISDLQYVIGDVEGILECLTETQNHPQERHLARLAIVYIAFAAQATISLKKQAGWIAKQFNDFAGLKTPQEQLRFPAGDNKKRLNEINGRWRDVRNMIAHPYRFEVEGREKPIGPFRSIFLCAAAADIKTIATDIAELSDACSDLKRWWGEAFVKGLNG